MKYLVLHRFWSYGKLLEKGSVVDASEIRSPSLRRSEGKITPAVPSSRVPEEFGAGDTDSRVLFEEDDITDPEEIEEDPEEIEEEPKHLFILKRD